MNHFRFSSALLIILAIIVMIFSGAQSIRAAPAAQTVSQGQEIYEQRCAACHGINGDGQGPGAERLAVPPRDFTRDEYEIKSTAGDEFPSREDLTTIIAEGMPGSSMPAWGAVLSSAEIEAVADYVQSFGRFFSQEGFGATQIEVPGRINPSEESIERGRILYHEEAECVRCHGVAGRGDGPSAFELTDNAGHVIFPADLTQPWNFRGGGDPEDIFLRLRTGMTGTPMPSYADALSAEDTWHLVNYVLSLSPEEFPQPAVLLTSQYVDGELPAGVDDLAWEEAPPAYYPLTGQIMRDPRHYQPAVNAVTAQSLYNDDEIAILVSWHDRTETRQGDAEDAVAVQFPAELSEGNERPYFVFGDDARPVYQWYWSAGEDAVVERNATGLDAIVEQTGSQQQTTAEAIFENGRWQVLFRRPLQTGDTEDLPFEPARYLPVSFMAWEGDAGEVDERVGLTTWSQLYLPTPTPLIEYIWIPVAMIVVVAAESLIMWRVRRTNHRETT